MFYELDSYMALPRPATPWLVEGFIPVGQTLMYGESKVGKSFLAMQLCSAIANPDCSDFFGMKVGLHGPVCYLQIDMPRESFAHRITKLTDVGFRFNNVHFADQLSGTPFPFNISNPVHRAKLTNDLASINPLLIVIDTLRKGFIGNENDSELMNHITDLFKAAANGAGVLYLHHARKPSTNNVAEPDVINDVRGSTALVAAVDMIVMCKKREVLWTGRSVEVEGSLELKQHRALNGAWDFTEAKQKRDRIIASVGQQEFASMRKAAETLASRLTQELGDSISVDAARKLLERRATDDLN